MTDLLNRLLAERDKFLEEHPKLKEYQKEIDDVLDRTPREYRLEAITIMMCSKALELADQLLALNKTLVEINNGKKGD